MDSISWDELKELDGLQMCGRFALAESKSIPDHFEVYIDQIPSPRFNIAPSQKVGVIGQGKSDRAFRSLQWGFVPSWAKEKAKPFINARSETAHEKASFRRPFKSDVASFPRWVSMNGDQM